MIQAFERNGLLSAYKSSENSNGHPLRTFDLKNLSMFEIENDKYDLCLLPTAETLPRLNLLCERIKTQSVFDIYVRLIDENAMVWRPVSAIHIKAHIFKIDSSTLIPNLENWEFQPGTLVQCTLSVFQDGTIGLIATSKFSPIRTKLRELSTTIFGFRASKWWIDDPKSPD